VERTNHQTSGRICVSPEYVIHAIYVTAQHRLQLWSDCGVTQPSQAPHIPKICDRHMPLLLRTMEVMNITVSTTQQFPPTHHAAVRVLVVEDETPVRERLCATVAADARLSLIGSAPSVATAKRWLSDSRRKIDVLLVDLGLPDGSGLQLIADCRQWRPHTAMMVMTMFGDERHVFAALEAGASGYLLKSSDSHAIVDHILDLHTGGSPITPTVARLVLQRLHAQTQPQASPPPAPTLDSVLSSAEEALSAREIEVLQLIAVGYSYAEIARRLSISVHTVTTHIRRIYQKLEVHSRSAAVHAAGQRGLL
jgi:DNA-binding NarL/FixJ family response regulator